MNADAPVRSINDAQKTTSKRTSFGFLLSALSSPLATVLIISFFIAALAVWDFLDHRIPNHDSAWHALYSSNVRRLIIHPKDWTLVNIQAIGKQHPGYPPGAWIINGILKVAFGTGSWADKLCLLTQTFVLAFSFYKLAMLCFADRLKANLGLIALLSFPLICVLQRQPFIDLLQVALFTAFIASLMSWKKSPSWTKTFLSAVLIGLSCISKQTAVLYVGPIVAILFLACLAQKQFKAAFQLFFVGICGISFLAGLWLIPNHAELQSYIQWRAPAGVSMEEKLSSIFANFKMSSGQVFQGAAPGFFVLLALLSFQKQVGSTIRLTWIPSVAVSLGWVLVVSLAYYNTPEPRYFGAVLVAVALISGALVAEALRSSSNFRRGLAVLALLFGPVQMLLLSFQPAPVVKAPDPVAVSPVFDFFGIKDSSARCLLGYERDGDPWKQRWAFNQIKAVENYRWVWLNVLPSTLEFDQGSMIYLGQELRSRAIPLTWRTPLADMSDSFAYTEHDFNTMDWFLLKTGNQGGSFKDKESLRRFEEVTQRIEHGDFVLIAQSELPDGSLLRLYRKDYAKIWNRNARLKAGGK